MKKLCYLIMILSFFALPQFSFARVGESLGRNLGSGYDGSGRRIDNYSRDRAYNDGYNSGYRRGLQDRSGRSSSYDRSDY